MTTESMQRPAESPLRTGRDRAGLGLALVRVTIGSMFVWVFFENLGKGLYTAGGYAGLIHYYMRRGHAPGAWKAVMGSMTDHAWLTAPLQGVTEISLGVLLLIGFFTRPAAGVAFLFLASLWVTNHFSGFFANRTRDSLRLIYIRSGRQTGDGFNRPSACPALGFRFGVVACCIRSDRSSLCLATGQV